MSDSRIQSPSGLWFDTQGRRSDSLPTADELLAEVQAQIASADCPHRDMLLRVEARLAAMAPKCECGVDTVVSNGGDGRVYCESCHMVYEGD